MEIEFANKGIKNNYLVKNFNRISQVFVLVCRLKNNILIKRWDIRY